MDAAAANDPTVNDASPEYAAVGSIETDALIIGAGPVGLFQVFELGLLNIRAHVVDSLSSIGGQCVELYGDKPIYDIPALPVCTGSSLVKRLLKQIAPFKPAFHLSQEVGEFRQRRDGRFDLATSTGKQFISRTIFIAAGVGAFKARRLQIEGIDAYQGSQLFYRIRDPADFYGKDLVICGQGPAAVDWAIQMAGKAKSVTVLHRRDDFHASSTSMSALRALADRNAIRIVIGQITGLGEDAGRMSALLVRNDDGVISRVPLDCVVVLNGLSPGLGPIVDWGLAIERKQLLVNTETFETDVPGIFAVGDVSTYPGKRKLILCGFHEATLAAYGAARHISPKKKIYLQYTTTSPSLHKLLGVNPVDGE